MTPQAIANKVAIGVKASDRGGFYKGAIDALKTEAISQHYARRQPTC